MKIVKFKDVSEECVQKIHLHNNDPKLEADTTDVLKSFIIENFNNEGHSLQVHEEATTGKLHGYKMELEGKSVKVTYVSSDYCKETIILSVTEHGSHYIVGLQGTKKGGTVERFIDYDYILSINII